MKDLRDLKDLTIHNGSLGIVRFDCCWIISGTGMCMGRHGHVYGLHLKMST